MRQAGVPPIFWAEAINTACYIRNRYPTKALDGQVPHRLWTGKKPTMIYMQPFGIKAFVLLKKNKGKFESRSRECTFVGYSQESKAYRFWCLETRTIVISRDVQFVDKPGFQHQYEEILEEEEEERQEKGINSSEPGIAGESREDHREIDLTRDETIQEDVPGDVREHDPQPSQAKRERGRPRLLRTGSAGRPRKVYQSADTRVGNDEEGIPTPDPGEEDDVFLECEATNLVLTQDPITWQKAAATQKADAWRVAMEDEYLAQIQNNTWEIVQRPQKRKVIGSKFVFSTKEDGITAAGKKKIRLVAKGCSQRPGEDFKDTYSPVVQSTSIRLLSAMAAELGLTIHQMDVVSAYLNSELEEDVFMEIPE